MASRPVVRAAWVALAFIALAVLSGYDCEEPANIMIDPGCAPPSFECNPIG